MLLERLRNDNISELKLNSLQIQMKNQVTQKVDNGAYKFENIDCPICHTSEKEVIGKKDRYGLYFETNLCPSCGLIYTSPRMTQESYNEFYNEEYRKLYGAQETATIDFFNDQKKRGKLIYDYLEDNKLIGDTPLFVFEVGCGAGGILKYFEEKGHDVKGIDLGREYVNYGRETYGLDLNVDILSNLVLERKPDLIIYSHVMEHILDLGNELDAIQKNLHQDSMVYIEVPGVKAIHQNYSANFLHYFQNAHTVHFTLESLVNLFSLKGFDLITGNQFVRSVFRFKNTQNDLVNDYDAAKKYILATEKKHRYYPFTKDGIIQILKKIYRFILGRK